MRSPLLPIALALALVAVGGAAPAVDAAPRRGKIVRIERPRSGAKGALRICQYNTDASATCFGQPPRPGEVGTLLTEQQHGASGPGGVRGTVRVKAVEATNPVGGGASACASGLWKADLELHASAPVESYGVWVVFDVELGLGARLVPAPDELPARVQGESAALTLDGDGDGEPDHLVTWYPSTASSAASQHYVVDFWQGGEGRWRRSRQDDVTWCM